MEIEFLFGKIFMYQISRQIEKLLKKDASERKQY